MPRTQQPQDEWFAQAYALPQADDSDQPTQSLWSMVDDRLRGRWRWMIMAGLVLGIVFAILGYNSTVPMYESTGIIHVAPRLPVTLVPIPETERIEQFASFMATQAQLIRSQRVLDHAQTDEKLKQILQGSPGDHTDMLAKRLTIESDRHSELINVTFEAPSAELAQAAANAIINSYNEIWGKAGGDEVSRTLQRLETLDQQLTRDLRATRTEAQGLLAQYQTSDLAELQSLHLQRVHAIEGRISDLKIAGQRLQANRSQIENTDKDVITNPMQLEAFDLRLEILRQRRDEAAVEYDSISQRFKPQSFHVRRAKQSLEISQKVYNERLVEVQAAFNRTGGIVPGGQIDWTIASQTPEQIELELDQLMRTLDALREESKKLSADYQRLSELQFEEQRIQADLDRTMHRIQQLELEESSLRSGRISIAQKGSRPRSPASDGRKRRAIAGLGFGGMASFGAFFLLGTIDRRAYGARQLRTSGKASQPACLGVLPDLNQRTECDAPGDVAAHCVHQIRNEIEALREHREGFVLSVTSAQQGDGKTSIVLALGWSYAAAGYRTLLVDCDLVGRSLTRQLNLVGSPGLKDALTSRNYGQGITNLAVQNLSALPVGLDASFGPEAVRHIDLARLYDSMRAHYDIIIVDTGPMLGSLESTPVVATSDSVVLAVRRGRSRTRLDECVARIKSVGGHCLGIILNCAARSECDRYVSEASLADAQHYHEQQRAQGDRRQLAASRTENALALAVEGATRFRSMPDWPTDDPVNGPSSHAREADHDLDTDWSRERR